MSLALRIAPQASPESLRAIPAAAIDPLLTRLANGPLPLDELNALPAGELAAHYFAVQHLWRWKGIELLNRTSSPDVALSASGSRDPLDFGVSRAPGRWKLSRFVCARRVGDVMRVESPRATAFVTLLQPRAAAMLAALLQPAAPADLLRDLDWLDGEDAVDDLLFLLRRASIIESCDGGGEAAEDADPTLRQWEFHDLLFHNRSRQGRHDEPLGGMFRFRGVLPPQPAVKPNPWAAGAIPLPKPSIEAILAKDPPFSAVLESRRSIRSHDDARPISFAQLGEFLFRAARNRYRFMTDLGEFASRPYPTGGASYEAEIYLTINRCADLERGFYYYDPEAHALCLVQRPNEDIEGLLDDAWHSAAQMCRPQVLITIASRFQRVAWKYSGIAYATQLKNVGVLYQTLYLVATAMSLAACGLGLGNSARFSRLARTNPLEEASIGEFMLGTPL